MKHSSPIIKIAKKVCPAVITIVVSKDLPKVEGYYLFPFGENNSPLPKIKKGNKELTKIGGGSGFIISKDGYILTCYHIVEDVEAEYSIIIEPGKIYPAKVLARNKINDIAILKIKANNLPYISLADYQPELGQEVVAVGNALGEFHDTLSSGIVSGLSRYIQATNSMTKQAERLRGLIQTDAAINPGNSGGPLIDMQGKVIGINTATVMGAQNIGFAIPIEYAKKDLQEIKKYGKLIIPFLGVKYIIITKEIAEKNKLPVNYGAFVVRETLGEPAVIKNSAAEKAGIQEFDIILEAKKENITIDNPLSSILKKVKPSETITLKILRNNKLISLQVTLEERNNLGG
ncbi:MAG: trypsin-like peptidase domain-containing protein [Candidatus Pacebacteria bacterium]|nr:trypsin-like peptidase domain-containing protein [Candidatus Paceibacterota bacterium]